MVLFTTSLPVSVQLGSDQADQIPSGVLFVHPGLLQFDQPSQMLHVRTLTRSCHSSSVLVRVLVLCACCSTC